MPSPTTYAELIAAVTTVAEDESDEFAAYLPTAIGLAEDRLFRELDFDFSNTTTVSTTISDNNLTKPLGHRVTHNLYVTVSGVKQRLIKKTEDFIYDYWPNSTVTDVPKYYADKDDLTWILAPTPNATYTITAEIISKPSSLSVTNTSNAILKYFPDVLFNATMSAMCEWMKDTTLQGVYEQKLQAVLLSANNEGRRYRQDDNTKTNNPETGRNTLTKASA